MNAFEEARAIEQEIIAWRRQIHQHPEIGQNLPQTAALVRQKLDEWGVEYREVIPNAFMAYIGKKGPEVIAQNEIPLFQQGLMMQQLNSEKLLVEGCIEGSYEKVLEAFTLNKTVPSMKVAKEILDDMIEANKEYWPELK